MPPPRPALSPKLQQLGKRMVLQLHMVLRTVRIHDANNNALLVATENLKDTINTLWAALGAIRFQFVDDVAYLNDVRLRLDNSASELVEWLRGEFTSRGLGGLAFARPVDTAALREFLVVLARPVESEEDAVRLRESLSSMKDLALEILGPRSFADDGAVEEIRIDKKTFALQTYAKALVAARECVDAMKAGEDPLSIRLPVVRIVQDLIDIATERVNLLLKIGAIKKADQYVAGHAANTCVLSIIIGKALSVDRLLLVDLGTSAFLADLGFALIDPELLERTEQLDDASRSELVTLMTGHVRTMLGHARISDAVIRRAVVAFEHHRPFKDPATGQPNNLHLFSRIVAVADAYDALTTIRPWRPGFAPDEALKILTREAGQRFDPLVVKVLVNLLGVYPLGSAVVLNSGEVAVVYHNSNDPRHFETPWVRVLRDAEGQLVKRTLIRNLAEHRGAGGKIVGNASAEHLTGLDPASLVLL